MTAEVTLDTSSKIIYILLDEYITKLSDINIYTYNKIENYKIFINGSWIGFLNCGIQTIIDKFKDNREKGVIHPHTSLYVNNNKDCIIINTSRGRFIRPLLKVKNGKLLLTQDKLKNISWRDLIVGDNFCIEYIDIYEINNCLVATTPDDLSCYGKAGHWY